MRIAEGATLFMGIKVDQKIREQLAACTEIDKRYFAVQDPAYLLFADGSRGEQFLGRTLGDSVSTDQLEDLRRNILSILKRIAPSVRPERALVIVPCVASAPPPKEPPPDESRSEGGM